MEEERYVLVPITEKVVDQYSPEWIAHVRGGGGLRAGNILTGDFGYKRVPITWQGSVTGRITK